MMGMVRRRFGNREGCTHHSSRVAAPLPQHVSTLGHPERSRICHLHRNTPRTPLANPAAVFAAGLTVTSNTRRRRRARVVRYLISAGNHPVTGGVVPDFAEADGSCHGSRAGGLVCADSQLAVVISTLP